MGISYFLLNLYVHVCIHHMKFILQMFEWDVLNILDFMHEISIYFCLSVFMHVYLLIEYKMYVFLRMQYFHYLQLQWPYPLCLSEVTGVFFRLPGLDMHPLS